MFLLLWDANVSKNPDYPVTVYPKLNLDDKDVAEVKTEFRFEKNDIPSLYKVLRIPEVFRCKQGSVCDGMTGLCIMLKRLTYPCRYSNMIPAFGISVPELCMIYNTVVDYIFNEHGHLIGRWNHTLLSSESLQRYADSIAAKEAACSRNITPAYISTFQSKRKGTISSKIHIPAATSSLVLKDNFWPQYVTCKPWRASKNSNKSNSRGITHSDGKFSTFV